ncbi:NAD(P)-binding protein [Xylariomycetidae sp. FL2044]|nr:NAD(P)-binding protein [Xylariomycetidae sp. FL2044]
MKLIITGGTGYIAKEVIRRSLSQAEITSVVAVARKPVPVPDGLETGADPSKLKSVTVQDYTEYSDEVKKEFAGADACIWTVALTPTKSRLYAMEDVKRICLTSTLAGFRAMLDAGVAKPFRFMYLSGATVDRDLTKKSRYNVEYMHTRAETENQLVALGAASDGVEVSCARPGLVTRPGVTLMGAVSFGIRVAYGVPGIYLSDLAAVLLDQVVNGFEKDPLTPVDLGRLAEKLQSR